MKKDLAIVIPAYKPAFLAETLESLANQTCKDFTLYIGDDASPYDLPAIIRSYEERITIVYKRFDTNFGANDLVAQWNRCLDLAERETWLWLFSDDDTLDAGCVETFFKHIVANPASQLLHFNIRVIDGAGKQTRSVNPFPANLSTVDFFSMRMKGEINSYVVEYIFRKSLYLEKNKFQTFDLAWSADDATWIKFSEGHGIVTLEGSLVNWRLSDQNISSIVGNIAILQRKIDACISFVKWTDAYFAGQGKDTGVSDFLKFKRTILTMIALSPLAFKEKYKLSMSALNKLNYGKNKALTCAFLLYIQVKRMITI